jgi:putative acetyltransferase
MIDMPRLPIEVRRERAGDFAPVRALLIDAFAGTSEADLVDVLRANDEIVMALVAERMPAIVVGYAVFIRLLIETATATVPAIGLAPIAVAASVRRRGVGGTLVRDGLTLLAERGEQLVFVLGDPAYYRRFGFDVAAAAPFVSRYAGAHFMVYRMTQTAPTNGTVRYPAAFAGLN